MSAKVESMMYVREKPWHGLGTEVAEAPTSADALRFAGLDWTVRQEPVYNARGGTIPGYRANVRDTDGSVLGIVGDRYKVVQNIDAFNFTDDLIGGEVRLPCLRGVVQRLHLLYALDIKLGHCFRRYLVGVLFKAPGRRAHAPSRSP